MRQVVLIPDSLAFERDTLLAPISGGHALRIGGVGNASLRPLGTFGWQDQ